MMRSTKLFGLFYFALGVVFVILAIQSYNTSGWGLFSIVCVAIAALDFMTAIKYLTAKKRTEKEN